MCPPDLVGLWWCPFNDAIVLMQTLFKTEENYGNLMDCYRNYLDETCIEGS